MIHPARSYVNAGMPECRRKVNPVSPGSQLYLQYSYLCAIFLNAEMPDSPVPELGYPSPVPECWDEMLDTRIPIPCPAMLSCIY